MNLLELFLSAIIIQKRKRVTKIFANHVSFMPISESSKAMADKPCRKPVNCKKEQKGISYLKLIHAGHHYVQNSNALK